jgi:hypothetical protein
VTVPQVPRPHSRRGRWLARQRADDAVGRFSERTTVYRFDPIDAGASAELTVDVTSMGGRYVRLLAMRGVVAISSEAPSPFDLRALSIRVQLNGQADMITGDEVNSCSMAVLFAQKRAPWLWFASPPLMRAGDLLKITATNGYAGEGAPTLTPELCFRVIDDELWQELFTRDLSADRLVT